AMVLRLCAFSNLFNGVSCARMHSTPVDVAPVNRKRRLLIEPTYGYGHDTPRRLTAREIWSEWLDAINFVKDRSRLLPAASAAYHFATFIIFVLFFALYFSLAAVASTLAIATFIATVYNTVWYHRYCSHRAFRFRNLFFARLFLWTNPVGLREESYVIPHRIHHSKSDEPSDPYGPHLGWLGSYLATESQQKMNRELSAQEYDRLAKSLDHLGIVKSSYAAYRRTGSVETVWHYVLRTLFANLFWCSLGWLVAGLPGAMAWMAGVFFYTFLVRDFNYRGHGGFFIKASKGLPANQIFYGIIAGEWHDNHHARPRSPRTGLEWWQVDAPYCIIKAMKLCGAVVQINSVRETPVREPATAPPQIVAGHADFPGRS
ncbi:MAG TPA: hypothetical protein VNT99_14395, partial [Methylomirabilota bacterium]|nr:hypothetical protein [Methylomirabilota bacterium]